MLSELEAALRRRSGWTLPELARALGESPALVAAALDQLRRMGRLPEAGAQAAAGGAACGGCGLAAWCNGGGRSTRTKGPDARVRSDGVGSIGRKRTGTVECRRQSRAMPEEGQDA